MASVIKKRITGSGAIRLNWFNYLPQSFAPNVLDTNVTPQGIKLIMKCLPNVIAPEIRKIEYTSDNIHGANNNIITNLNKPMVLSLIHS